MWLPYLIRTPQNRGARDLSLTAQARSYCISAFFSSSQHRGLPRGSPRRSSTSLFSNRRNENDLVKHTRRAYPVSRHSPSERSPARQIGIRMALGAKHAKVAQLILGWMSRRVFAGLLLGLGLPLAVGGGRLISSQLYGISSWDPMALMIAASALAMSAFAAGIIPSTRAALISPNGGLANGIADLPRLRLALPSDPLRSLGPGQHGQIVRPAWEPTTQQASRPIQTVAGWEYGLSPGPAAGRPLVMIRAGIPRRSTPGTYVPYCVPRPTQRKGCRIG